MILSACTLSMKNKVNRTVPHKIKFNYPNGVTRTGNVIAGTPIRYHRNYATSVEVIKFAHKNDKHIRFAYWRKSKGKDGIIRWRWASQTTWVFSLGITRRAIKDAKKIGLL